MALGGGLDIKLSKYVSFRPIGLDWYMTRLQNMRTLGDNNQHNIRYTTGLNFTFGRETPAPPLPSTPRVKACWDGSSVPEGADCPNRVLMLQLMASESRICPGTTATISVAGDMPDGVTRQWSVNGESVSGGATFEFGATGRNAGEYKVALATTAPGYNDASAETTIVVLPYSPPTGTLQISPSEIQVGEQATVTAQFSPGQCGGSVSTPVITAVEGAVEGNRYDSSSVQFDPAENSEQQKTIRLEATVRDNVGEGKAHATVVVKKKAVIAATRLPDIVFPAGSSRVNNCGKRVLLEELKSFMERDPRGNVVLVGHVGPGDDSSSGVDQQRALNAAAVISAGQGICGSFPASQILIGAAGTADNGVDLQPHFCGTSVIPRTGERRGQAVRDSDEQAKFRRVEVWFVPADGKAPASLAAYQNASTLPLGQLGCPR
jgi:hypothetical protein